MTHPGSKTLRVFKSDAGKSRYTAVYDARLRNWPVPYEEIDLPCRFGTTHVIASGSPDAPPLALLACMMGTATVWRANVATLSRHYRTYAIDVIGEPNRSQPTRRIRSRRGYAEWFTDLLDALGVDRTCIVGNSYGGFLALNQASLTPERVERVVLISPAATFAPIWSFYLHAILGGLSSLSTWFTNGVPLHPLDASWDELMSLAVVHGRPVNMVPPRVLSKAELQRIRAPTLLLIGDKEVIYRPHATLKRALNRMPGLEGEIVRGANHVAAMTRPDEVNQRIIHFLQRRASNSADRRSA